MSGFRQVNISVNISRDEWDDVKLCLYRVQLVRSRDLSNDKDLLTVYTLTAAKESLIIETVLF